MHPAVAACGWLFNSLTYSLNRLLTRGCVRGRNGDRGGDRSFGDQPFKKFVTAEPFLTSLDLEEGDSFVVICCDGIWDVITDEEAVTIVSDALTSSSSSQHSVGPRVRPLITLPPSLPPCPSMLL